VQLAGTVQLAQDGHDAAGAVHVFDVVLVGVGRHLAQLRHRARQAVDVGHGEVDLGLLRNGQHVQDGVGGAAHGDVQRHRVLERLEAHRARQHRLVVLLVVALAQFHRQAAGALEQLLAVGVRGHHGAVAGQRQAQRLGQAVHRVGGEHARAGAAGRAGRALDLGQVGVADLVVGGHHHRVDQVELA
jgi:hypothetical protein